MSRLIILILISCFGKASFSQIASQPKFYTSVIRAKVIKTDTVFLNDVRYKFSSKAIAVRIKTINLEEGQKEKIKRIIMELPSNEHSCIYDFRRGKTYKLYVYAASYSSDLIKRKYRKKHFRIDCYHLPELQKN